MKNRWFNLELNLFVGNLYFSLNTPDFNRERHRPSFIPKWELSDLGEDYPCENRYFFYFDWFFHFTCAWGKPKT